VQDHELKQLRQVKDNLDHLKNIESQLDEKDQTIAELKKKVMVQEEAISSWIEAMDTRKKENKELQSKVDVFEKETEMIYKKMAQLKEDYERVNKENVKATNQKNELANQLYD